MLLCGCAGHFAEAPSREAPTATVARGDLAWLQRVGFGIDSASLQSLARLGRRRYLDAQLAMRDAPLPSPVAHTIDALEVSRLDAAQAIAAVTAERRRIDSQPDDDERNRARQLLNERGNRLAGEAAQRDLLRAIHSPAQLQEQMVWFWLNHFSVYGRKAELRWLVGDYEEHAIRPHALGRFRDLVLATLEHPAMLQYLDNRQNRVGHSNENYARELLELHTLGVDGGYTQQDVQQLARILTGVGIDAGPTRRLPRGYPSPYLRRGAFEFNPAQHDFGDKVLLGRTIRGRGFGEVEEAVTVIVRQKACAQHVAMQLARYFVADDPPAPLVQRVAGEFQRTDGDIAAVLRTLFLSPELDAAAGRKFKDPERFVVSALRFAYDGRPVGDPRPALRWLADLGEPPYGHQTPDGYGLAESAWASSGQMSRRFEIARAIGSGSLPGGGFPQLSSRLYFATLEPQLSAQTRSMLDRASSQNEWNMLLLSSPEFNYE